MIKLSIDAPPSSPILPHRRSGLWIAAGLLAAAVITAAYFAFVWRPVRASAPVSTAHAAVSPDR